jgi:very-short-patch-repair endonuclease
MSVLSFQRIRPQGRSPVVFDARDSDGVNARAEEVYIDGEEWYADKLAEFGYDRNARGRILGKLRGQFGTACRYCCDSPIEEIMLAALVWAPLGCEYHRDLQICFTDRRPLTDVVIAPQHEIVGHRVDFAVFVNRLASHEVRVVVECDGHEFHEKTREQVARDNRRHRELQISGWEVFRFSGSEIWNGAVACCGDIDRLIRKDHRPAARLASR